MEHAAFITQCTEINTILSTGSCAISCSFLLSVSYLSLTYVYLFILSVEDNSCT